MRKKNAEFCLFLHKNKNTAFYFLQISEKMQVHDLISILTFCNFKIIMVIMQNFEQLEEKRMWIFFSATLELKISHNFFQDQTKNHLYTLKL